MPSSNAKAWNQKYILMNNLGREQPGTGICPVYVILQ